MAWQPTIYSFLGFGAVVLCAIIVRQAWSQREERGAYSFLAMVLVGGGWSLIYAVQLGFSTLPEQLLWQRAGIAMSGAVPSLLFLFSVKYAGRDRVLTRGLKILLIVEPIVFAVLTFTNPVHELLWEEAALTMTMGGQVLDLALGPGFYGHIVYAYVLVAVALGFIFHVFTEGSQIYRKQSGLLLLGVFPPFVSHIAFTFQVSLGPLPELDPTPFVFVLTGTMLVLALFRFDLLERTPIARQRVIEEMGDGLLVLDSDGRIVDSNPVARQIFDTQPDVDSSIEGIVSEDAETAEDALEALDGRTVTATVDGRERSYDIDWSSIIDHRGETVSHVISLRDVTDRKEYEQRLEVANRVLRHNLRNDMNVILGSAEQLADETTDNEDRVVDRILRTAENLVELSEKAQTISRIEDIPGSGGKSINVAERVGDIVEEFEEDHPDVTIEYEAPDSKMVETTVPRQELFDIPLRNLIENAIEHNDSDEPWVRVSVEPAIDRIRIHVEDNASEIPATEREVFKEGREAPMHHGSGMGLWLTYWSAKSAGGDIKFDLREPRGNVVTLEFP